jgi:hypothetical protein
LAAGVLIAGLAAQSASGHAGSHGYKGSSAKSIVTFSGIDIAKDAFYSYSGIVVALNRDLGKDGFLVKAYGAYGTYEYDSNVRIEGTGLQGDLMLGYKLGLGRMYGAAWMGVDVQDYDLDPNDPTSRVRGSEVGFKVGADLETNAGSGPMYLGLSGIYSTAFDTYWTRARVGYDFGRFIVGPEGVLMGNEGYDATRIGGFVKFDMPLLPATPTNVTLSAGHQDVDGGSGSTGGGDGAYGSLGLVFVF